MIEKNKILFKEDIEFDNTSYIDPNGQVFKYQNRIYRAISDDKQDFFIELLQKDFFKAFCENDKIVKTNISDLKVDGFGLILEHGKVNRLTYCVEWPPEMLKAAALLTLDLTIELSKHSLTLQDAYPWNVYFNNTHPVFIDVGSIVPANPNYLWKPYDQFCRFFLFPLYLHSKGKSRITNLLLSDYFEGVSSGTFLELLGLKDKLFSASILSKAVIPHFLDKLLSNKYKDMGNKYGTTGSNLIKPETVTMFLEMLKKDIERINATPKKEHWFKYYNMKFDQNNEGKNDLDKKTEVIAKILDKCAPKSVLDQGANTGHFSMIAAEKGIPVISCEKDISCVNLIYNKARKKGLNIIPLVSDFINPTPSFGWCSKQFPSFLERTKSDMVLALALIHHLVFKQWQSFDRIAESLDHMSHKWAVVEYIPIDDEFIKPCWEERFSFYSIENLIKSMRLFFKKIEVLDSYPEGRKILLCEK